MATLDVIELIALTESGEEQKAADMVSAYMKELTPAERGAAYISMASVYMKLLAKNQKKVAGLLQSQLQELKELKTQEIQDINDLDIESVRQQL